MTNCNDCNAAPGSMHTPGCDVERCSICGGQRIGCNCIYEANDIVVDDLEEDDPIYTNGPTAEMYAKFDALVEQYGGRLPWTGEYPWTTEAARLGFYCYEDGGRLVRCAADHPKAEPDLNRLHMAAEWDKQTRTWSRRERR